MQCIFIVNNNIQKRKEGKKGRKVSSTENKKFGGGNKQDTNTNQTLPKEKIGLTCQVFLSYRNIFFKRSVFIQKSKDAIL